MPERSSRIAVGIITMGRAAVLAETLAEVLAQTRPADRILVCATADKDVRLAPPGVEIMFAPPGTSLQRNRLIEAAADCDLLVFLDDDFVPEPTYLAATEAAFRDDPGLVVSTGIVLADGASGPGIDYDAARRTIAAAPPPDAGYPEPAYNGYGCNMAIRLAPALRYRVRFDEALRFYGWYEDLDFTRRLGRHGLIRRLPRARGVHLGTKSGRGPGARLGYAQVINPIHLARRGSYHWNRALRSIFRHIAMNLLRSLWPEPWIDRRGRLRGNLVAIGDLLLGRIDPTRVERL
jgi:GT2 family glycosyltransferase